MSNDEDMGSWVSEFFELNPDTVVSTQQVEEKKYKLDLFKQILPALDRGNKQFYSALSDDEKESISPWLLMRWMTSAGSDRELPHYLLSVNDLVNSNFMVMSPKKTLGIKGHEELQWMLLCLCGTGKTPNRKFISPAKGVIKSKVETAILKFYPNLRDDELELFLAMNSEDELKDFFKDNGYDDKSIKEIFKGK